MEEKEVVVKETTKEEIEELEKDVIVMPQKIEDTLKNMEEQVQKVANSTEVLDVEQN